MNVIALFDSVYFIASIIALLFVLVGKSKENFLKSGHKLLLSCLLVSSIVYSFCLFIEWSGLNSKLNEFEDIVGALLPLWWAFIFYAFVKEISNHNLKVSKEKLKKSEAHFRALLETIPDMVWLKDPDGIYLSCNPKLERLFGEKEANIIRKTDYDFVDKKLADFFREKDKKAMAAGKPTVNEEEVVYADDGHKEILETIKTPMFDPDGNLIGVLGIARDITNRKQVENKLQSREKFLDRLIDQSPFATWISDPEGTLIRANPTLKRILNLTDEQLVGKYNVLKDPLVEKQGLLPLVKSVFEEGKTVNFICQWDGNEIPTMDLKGSTSVTVDLTMFPIFNSDGELTNVVVKWIDISESKKAENQIKESHERLLTVLDSLESIVYVADFETYEILYANKYFTKNFGEATGKTCWKVIQEGQTGPCEFCSNDKLLDAAGEPTETYVWEFQNTITGKWYYIHDRAIKWIDGRYVRMEIATDITEKKNAEEENINLLHRLQQAQKMEAIGTLAGGIAHDFNNILAAILGYAEMAKDGSAPGSRIEKNLNEVLKAADRAKNLVKQILAFSRQSDTERSPINILPLVKEALKMLRSSIPTTISITEQFDPQIGIILADPTHIHQIMINLCTNAYHAMEEEGGELSVSLKPYHIYEQENLLHLSPGEYIELTVTDTGVGMEKETVDRIFDPYYTTKETGKGTGMGLAIVHGIVSDCGGTVTVESTLGRGTALHVYLPVVAKEALPNKTEADIIPQGKERVLFVDDEETLAKLGENLLESLGYQVTVKRNSFDALETFQNTPDEFDIVITDQTMPGITGADLARKMLQIRPDIPIILCTGYSTAIDEESAKSLGIKEFAMKPLTRETLAKLIRKTLGTP